MSQSLSVLVVDDNKDMVFYLRSYLAKKGHKTQGVHSVPEALEILSVKTFDVMIVDVVLENFSGISLLKSIKGRRDLTPVIMISAHGTHEMAKECLSLGASDFLFKPFHLQVIEDILISIATRKARLDKMGVSV